MSVAERLKELGITVPGAAAPAAGGLYSPCVQTGSLLFVSGQIPRGADARGKLGAAVSIEQGQALARECALNALGIVQAHLGTLERSGCLAYGEVTPFGHHVAMVLRNLHGVGAGPPPGMC